MAVNEGVYQHHRQKDFDPRMMCFVEFFGKWALDWWTEAATTTVQHDPDRQIRCQYVGEKMAVATYCCKRCCVWRK